MLESTFAILSNRAVAIPALVFALVITYRYVETYREPVTFWSFLTGVTAIALVFVTQFLAEFVGHPFFQWLADAVIRAEAAVGFALVDFIDSAYAAFLRTYLLVLDAVWLVVRETLASAVPTLASHEFLMTVFAFEFLGGVVLVQSLYGTLRHDDLNSWFKAVGLILTLTGMLATLVRLDGWNLGGPALANGFVAGMLGLALGVSSIILVVRPNFDGESVLSKFRNAERRSRPEDGDETTAGREAAGTPNSDD